MKLYLNNIKNLILLLILFYNFNGYSQTAEEWFYKGFAKANLKDYQGAIADYDRSISINPNLPGPYDYRGLAKFILQDYAGAITDANKALAIDTNNVDAYVLRGKAKSNLGNKKGACEDWTKALKLGFSDASIFIKKYCK